MSEEIKYAIVNTTETVKDSVYKDFVTGSMCAFCVYISQGSTFWTFVTGSMFLVFMIGKLNYVMKRVTKFKTKAEVIAWLDRLPE